MLADTEKEKPERRGAAPLTRAGFLPRRGYINQPRVSDSATLGRGS